MEEIRHIIAWLVLAALQVLVCNHIHLLGYAMPLVAVYFILRFRRGYPRWALLLWGFSLGLVVDVFADAPGVGAASMTLAALLQPVVLEWFLDRDEEEDFVPSLSAMGWGKFFNYAFLLTLIFTVTFFTLETFNFFHWQQWALSTVSSVALTLLLILAVEHVRR